MGASKVQWFLWWAFRAGIMGVLTSIVAILPGENLLHFERNIEALFLLQ
jgi:hypothetical protein